MKLLDIPALSNITNGLSGDFGDVRLSCRVESYSCKMAGEDKRLFKILSSRPDFDQLELLSPSPSTESPRSPSDLFGDSRPLGLAHKCSSRTLYYLKATLNAAFSPDYDFSEARGEEFCREPSLDFVRRAIGLNLESAMRDEYRGVEPLIWKTVEEQINPSECQVYAYRPDMCSDPFAAEGCLWSFNYFWYNKKLKRILFFRGRAVSADAPMLDDEYSYNHEEAFEMEM